MSYTCTPQGTTLRAFIVEHGEFAPHMAVQPGDVVRFEATTSEFEAHDLTSHRVIAAAAPVSPGRGVTQGEPIKVAVSCIGEVSRSTSVAYTSLDLAPKPHRTVVVHDFHVHRRGNSVMSARHSAHVLVVHLHTSRTATTG